MKKTEVKDIIKRYAFMALASLSYSLSLSVFLVPNKIVGGGVSGAASLINILTGLPTGVFIIALNIPILIGGYKIMGARFTLRCLITTATLGGITTLTSYLYRLIDVTVTTNKILAAVYGGILQGVGIGLFIKYEMSSGGTELLGRITHKLVPVGTIAAHAAVFDGLIVLAGAIGMKDFENVLYALILVFVCAKVSDIIVMGFTKAKLCYVITEKYEEISDFLLSHSPRGITLINGEGLYSKRPKGVLLTCVKNNQIEQIKQAVKTLDENAFVIVCDAHEVYGKGFHQF